MRTRFFSSNKWTRTTVNIPNKIKNTAKQPIIFNVIVSEDDENYDDDTNKSDVDYYENDIDDP